MLLAIPTDARTPARHEAPADAATVLLVDDEPDILEAIEELLLDSLPHVRVVTAHSGAEGLAVLRSERVDVIVTDYKMPGMTGVEFLSAADKVAPGARRILVTAFGREYDRSGAAVHLDAFFRKPLDPRALLQAMRAMLGA